MYEFTEEQHRLWPRMLEIMERSGRRLDPRVRQSLPGGSPGSFRTIDRAPSAGDKRGGFHAAENHG
jgi:hypothetical protein